MGVGLPSGKKLVMTRQTQQQSLSEQVQRYKTRSVEERNVDFLKDDEKITLSKVIPLIKYLRLLAICDDLVKLARFL